MRAMRWAAQTIANGLLWLAAAVALVGMLFAAAIPIRTPHALDHWGPLSFALPGLVLTVLLAGCAYAAERRPGATIQIALLSLLIGLVGLVVMAFTLAYVCFDIRANATHNGCAGVFGSEWLAGASIVCALACPILSLLALVAAIVAVIRRR